MGEAAGEFFGEPFGEDAHLPAATAAAHLPAAAAAGEYQSLKSELCSALGQGFELENGAVRFSRCS